MSVACQFRRHLRQFFDGLDQNFVAEQQLLVAAQEPLGGMFGRHLWISTRLLNHQFGRRLILFGRLFVSHNGEKRGHSNQRNQDQLVPVYDPQEPHQRVESVLLSRLNLID